MVESRAPATMQKLDTVSPATRLLDKRRKMYENQEAYLAKKKHFAQQEYEFQAREGELREEDHKLQQSLIQYAIFLDNNAKAMRICDTNITNLRNDNKNRDAQIEQKKRQLTILRAKKERIEQQKNSVEQYQSFLERVRSENIDIYSEVREIRERFMTQDKTRKDLTKRKAEISEMYEKKRAEVNNYERSMEN